MSLVWLWIGSMTISYLLLGLDVCYLRKGRGQFTSNDVEEVITFIFMSWIFGPLFTSLALVALLVKADKQYRNWRESYKLHQQRLDNWPLGLQVKDTRNGFLGTVAKHVGEEYISVCFPDGPPGAVYRSDTKQLKPFHLFYCPVKLP